MKRWLPLLLLGMILGGCGADVPSPTTPGYISNLCAQKTLTPWSRKSIQVGGVVSFHEIMFHSFEDPSLEWIEIYNPLAIPVDLSGFRLDGAIRYRFPLGTFIAGRGLHVVAADADLLNKSLGKNVAAGSYTGQLPDDGGTIELWNNAGRRLDALSYGDGGAPWPVLSFGSGASLAKRVAGASSQLAENWAASHHQGGTPGQTNFAPGAIEQVAGALAFHKLAGGGEHFWIELRNGGTAPVELGDHVIVSPKGRHLLKPGLLPPGAIRLLSAEQLGFSVAVGDRIFLLGPAEGSAKAQRTALDGVQVERVPRGRQTTDLAALRETGERATDAPWLYPDQVTPGGANVFIDPPEVVINEIMYQSPATTGRDGVREKSPVEWIEVYNRGSQSVDLGGFQLVDAVEYHFPAGVILPAGSYLVVANDTSILKQTWPELPSSLLLGNMRKSLSNDGESILLLDRCGNPVNRVHYRDGGRWPTFAGGGGSSLELMDPRADNHAPEAWAKSDTTKDSQWENIQYEGVATPSPVGPDHAWQELVLGLLDAGEVMLDDISVVVDPEGEAKELITGGDFEGDTTGFRLLGNHRHSQVVVDPSQPDNHVLRLVATGPTEHMHNHVEVTLADGHRITNGLTYRISLRARWLAGSSLLNTRLYFNRLARTSELWRPLRLGTPGRPNSTSVDNLGPTYEDLRHAPAVPRPAQPVEVSVRAEDPDGVSELMLFWSVNGEDAAWQSVPMFAQGDNRYKATIIGQAAATLVQFYIIAKDSRGATSFFPAHGADSRALFRVDDGQADKNGLPTLRILLHPTDVAFLYNPINLMSNDYVGGTIIENEHEIYYDVGVRIKSSQRGRPETPRAGFGLRFQQNQRFRGVYDSVLIDRSEGVGYGQREFLIEQVMNRAGTVPSRYNDLAKVLTPRPEHTGPAELQLSRYGDLFLEQQFIDGADGMLFEYELIYYPLTTDDGTPTGYKRPKPDAVVGTAIRDLGADKEAYRFSFIIKNNRWRDDYRGLASWAKVFGQSGAVFDNTVNTVIDEDQWLRALALANLSGAVDNYAAGAAHNANFYIRPSDGRVLYFPHDLDFYNGSPQGAIVASPDLVKLIARPDRARRYAGHLYDIISTAYNDTYMGQWCDWLGQLLPGQNFASHLNFIRARADWVLNGAPNAVLKTAPRVDFSITTNGGMPLDVMTDTLLVHGTGWLDVAAVYRDSATPLVVDLTWTTQTSWEATLSLLCGMQAVTLVALGREGQTLARSTLQVTRSGEGCP